MVVFLLIVVVVILLGGRSIILFAITAPLLLAYVLFVWDDAPWLIEGMLIAMLVMTAAGGLLTIWNHGGRRRWENWRWNRAKSEHVQERLGAAVKLGDNLYLNEDGAFLVVTPQGSIRTYKTERGVRRYLERASPRSPRSGSARRRSHSTVAGNDAAFAGLAVAAIVGCAAAVYLVFGMNRTTLQGPTTAAPSPATNYTSESRSAGVPAHVDEWTDPNYAHPDRWADPNYSPDEADYDLIARQNSRGDPHREKDMKDALCALYQNCE